MVRDTFSAGRRSVARSMAGPPTPSVLRDRLYDASGVPSAHQRSNGGLVAVLDASL